MPLNLKIIKYYTTFIVRKVYGILVTLMLVCFGCQWQLKSADDAESHTVSIQRYDRIESLYLTTGDYSAMQQMNTYFPEQTRMLIEDVLQLGQVNDADINTKFLFFFQDSTLQRMLTDVQQQYTDIDDLNEELSASFERLHQELPHLDLPDVYAQIGSFDQSIIIGTGTLGISLDKYLGADYPFYLKNYTPDQRSLMVRSMIVPDCLAFYILSQYPVASEKLNLQKERDLHMGRIQWTVNLLTGRQVFDNDFVKEVDEYMQQHPSTTISQLLSL